MLRFSSILFLILQIEFLSAPDSARAQDMEGCRVSRQILSLNAVQIPVKNEQGVEEPRLFLTGSPTQPVQIDCDDMQLFADQMQVFNRRQVVASGNVVFVSGSSRIWSDRLEFDTKTRTGTFYQASGVTSLGNRLDRSFFGTQEPDAWFWGEEIEKIGPKKYRITQGGFTTCVQPTPRWQISSGAITLNLDDYAFLTNSVFRVKGVPLMYLPVFYYPIQEDDRATGILIPTYGTSTVQGHRISNAFFWAIGRSHDATLFHDLFTKTGQAFGGEYRYELGGGSRGTGAVHVINEHGATYAGSSGQVTTPSKRSFQVNGGLSQALPHRFQARVNADYFSDIGTQQRYQQNVYRATNPYRRFGGNVTGNWREYVLSATLDKSDLFYGINDLTTTGSLPKITFTRGERPVRKSPFYVALNSEYVTFLHSRTQNDVKVQDQGLTRMDVNPVLRVPFTRWPFLSLNSTVSWRGTYWSESRNASGVQVPDGIGRRFFEFQSRVTGPVFTRIWNTPGGAYAEKYKHVIEPTLALQRVTSIDNFDRIVDNQIDQVDRIVGNTTRLIYGINNRLYAKKGTSREIASVSINQTYYSNPRAAQYDPRYQSSFSGTKPTNFSPVRLVTRAVPADRLQAEFSTEWDPTAHTLTTFGATGTFRQGSWLQTSAGWSQRRLIPTLPGFDNPAAATHYLNANTSVRNARNHVGASYTFNYDLRNDRFLNQRYTAYYNAQCCGIGVEYQTFNFRGGFTGLPIPQDRRFNVSFTLAGIGTFSNFLGAFGGQDR